MLASGNLLDRLGRLATIRQIGHRGDLVAEALRQPGCRITSTGAVSVSTGAHTGRSPKDKFIVRDGLTEDSVWWEAIPSMSPEQFDGLLEDALAYASSRDLILEDLAAGADPAFSMAVSVVTETAWHALFIRNLLLAKGKRSPAMAATILHLPGFLADPARHGTRSSTVIALDLSRNIVLIGGTAYAGEIKKSVFSLFNFHAPRHGILPMHCSANVGLDGQTALFFGLSGTGKTTLSSDPERPLIGDDEHLWGERGIANIEGGCYAKTAALSAEAEPEIFTAAKAFGTVLENVVVNDATGTPDYQDLSRTENTRAAYPLTALDGVVADGVGAAPKAVVFLTADAFGVLPPVARLTAGQAVDWFLAGYTAKVAGTERGVTEPTATFSACFGAPFLSHRPQVYSDLLAEKLKSSGAAVWLVNTGWIGGAAGTGKRIDIGSTRRIVRAVLAGELDVTETRIEPNFGLAVPLEVDGIDRHLLEPRRNWTDGAAYDAAAARLKGMFDANLEALRSGRTTEVQGG